MNQKKIFPTILISLLLISVLSATQFEVKASMDPEDPVTERKTTLVFTVDPDGQITAKGSYEQVPGPSAGGTNVEVSVSITETGEISDIVITLPPETVSEFPYNTTTLSMLLDYVDEIVTAELNATMELPIKIKSQSPLNSTDLTMSMEYSNGDLDFLIDGAMSLNLTEIFDSMFGIFVGFNQSFEVPMVLELDYSKGEYEGLIVLHLLPGLPIGDLELYVSGNLTDICFNGTSTVIYGNYPYITIDLTTMDMIEYMAENVFNASIDVEGSLLNMTEGKLSCNYIDVQRENITGGESVSFEVRIHGDFIDALALLLSDSPLGGYYPGGIDGEIFPPEMGGQYNLTYHLLNETLYKIQNMTIDASYTPEGNVFCFMLNGTVHLEDLVEQVTDAAETGEWLEPIPEEGIEALLMLNKTIHSIQNATFDLNYGHEGTADLQTSIAIDTKEIANITENGVGNSIFSLLEYLILSGMIPDWIPGMPENMTELIDASLEDSLVEAVSSHLQLTYADGEISINEQEVFEGDINAEVNRIKSVLLEYFTLNTVEPDGLPWQVQFINDTSIGVTGLDVWLKLDNTSALFELKRLTITPLLDEANATDFKMERFFNLTSESEFPGNNETMSVTVVGGSNSTHKIVLYRPTSVPLPDSSLKDALNRTVLMTWNNVTLSSLKELEFITVSGTQTGEVISEPEKVTSSNPIVINATNTLGTMINITGISQEASIVVSNVTEPADVTPPPGTYKVLGNYVQISVSNETVAVNATIRMYYTDEELAAAGVAESTLTINRWNGTDWEPIEPSYVNTEENYVWAYLDHFSVFALMGDVPPIKVALSTSDIAETSLKLTWTANADPDFARYEIFRSTSSAVLGVSIANVTNQATLSLSVTGLSSGTKYYFTVRVWDTVGLYTDSDQINVTTALPMFQQPWFIGTVVAVIAIAAIATIILRRKGTT